MKKKRKSLKYLKKRLLVLLILILLAGIVRGGMWYRDNRPLTSECTIIELPYDEITSFRNNLALVSTNGKMGVINADGIEVIPLDYPARYPLDSRADAIILDNDRIYLKQEGQRNVSIADTKGQIFLTIECDKIFDFRDGLYSGIKGKDRIFCDPEGHIVMSYDAYESVSPYENGYAIVRKDGKYGLIDREGNLTIPLEHDTLSFDIYGRISVKKDGKWVSLDPSNNTIVPDPSDTGAARTPTYTRIKELRDNRAIVQKYGSNDKWGIINFDTDRMIVPLKYDAIRGSIATEGPVAVREGGKDGGKWGYVDITSGALVIPVELEYDSAEGFREGLARVKKGDKYGFIDTRGKLVIPLKYDEAEEFKNGLSLVKTNEKYCFINTKGKKTTSIDFDKIFPLNKEDAWIMSRYEAQSNYDDERHYGSLGGNAIALSGTTWYLLKP